MLVSEILDILLGYLEEETDGEFLRYYRLNPAALRALAHDLADLAEDYAVS